MATKSASNHDLPLLLMSIGVQLVLGLLFGHAYDMRVFMATGYLVGTGQNPHVAQNLTAIFDNSSFQGLPTVGYPPPWSLLLGLMYLITYRSIPNLLLYNLAIKLPIILANICLAFFTASVLRRLGAEAGTTRKAWLFLLFNPWLLYATAAWGQFDSIVALLCLLAIVLLSEGKLMGSAILLALAVSFKPTAVPLLVAAVVYLHRRPFRHVMQYCAIFLTCAVVLVAGPFVVLGWDPGPILRQWNGHFDVGGGLSFMTFWEIFEPSYRLPGLWWLLGLLWAPALLIAAFALKPGGEGILDLLKKGSALTLVFFLSRTWVSEPNIILVLPPILILTSMGELDRRALTAVWLLPLVFSLFNVSAWQLLFPSMPAVMDRLLQASDVYYTARLMTRTIVVLPWLLAGGWIVGQCLRKTQVSRLDA